jgi:hypothetical protein
MATTKRFAKTYLVELGLPWDCEGGEVIEDKIEDQRRWSTDHGLIFRLPGQAEGEAWETGYSVGSTECQEERPWDGQDEVECTLVHAVQKTVTVWEPKP